MTIAVDLGRKATKQTKQIAEAEAVCVLFFSSLLWLFTNSFYATYSVKSGVFGQKAKF